MGYWQFSLCKAGLQSGMTKEQAIALAGSQAKLAALLEINDAAVSQWVTIPKARLWQLKVLRPGWFAR